MIDSEIFSPEGEIFSPDSAESPKTDRPEPTQEEFNIFLESVAEDIRADVFPQIDELAAKLEVAAEGLAIKQARDGQLNFSEISQFKKGYVLLQLAEMLKQLARTMGMPAETWAICLREAYPAEMGEQEILSALPSLEGLKELAFKVELYAYLEHGPEQEEKMVDV